MLINEFFNSVGGQTVILRIIFSLITATVVIFTASPPAAWALKLPDYPSQQEIAFSHRTIKPGDSLFKLFKTEWETVARFNRIDEKRLIAGMRIKVPNDLKAAKDYAPMPKFLEKATQEKRFILIDIAEQFLGAYEFGESRFSMPISSANPECLDEEGKKKTCYTPSGTFRVMAFHRDHVSSLYKDAVSGENVPMPYAVMFFIEKTEKGSVAYWIHGGELPGYPASHGCIRLRPKDAMKLFAWLGGNLEKSETVWVKNGAPIEIVNNPIVPLRQGDAAVVELPEIPAAQNVKAFLESANLSARGGSAFGGKKEVILFQKSGTLSALIAVDISEKPGLYHLSLYDSETNNLIEKKTILIGKGVFPKHVSKGWNKRVFSKKELERINKEKQELARGYQDGLNDPRWLDGFELPIETTKTTGQITHPFGEIRINPVNKRSRFHKGADVRAPHGFPIRAIAAGRVSHTGYDYFLEGNITVIDHGSGIFSTYLHQSKILVNVGDTVSKGQTIGEVGQTGNADGPHLHFSAKINGATVDPMKLIENIKSSKP